MLKKFMRTRRSLWAVGTPLFLLALLASYVAIAQAPDLVPDKILLNGKIVTVDKTFSIVEAAAIRDGKFVALGSSREIRQLAGPHTELMDLQGKTVVPGFTDGHAHMDREGLKYVYPSLEGARSIDDILKVIEREVKKKKPGEWVVTMPVGDPPYYDNAPAVLKEKRYPDRWDLDKVSPNNPVYIRGIWGYWNRPPIVSIANSYALRLANITRDTLPPYDKVTIHKDPATGEPTGMLSENDFVPVLEFSLMKMVPRFTAEHRLETLRDSQRRYNAVGTTSTYEGHGIAAEVVEAYKKLWEKRELTVRSHLVISPTPGKNITQLEEMIRDWAPYAAGLGFGDDRLQISGLFVQSGGDPHIAKLTMEEAPYTAWAAYYYDSLTPEKFRQIVFLCAKYGLRVNTITASEKDLSEALTVFEEVNKTYPMTAKRWVVEHLIEASPENIHRMKELGVVTTANVAKHLWKTGSPRLKRLTPKARFAPYKSVMDAGIPLVLATDNIPIEPFRALWAVVSRKDDASGQVLVPEEKLTREEALRAMTINGAYLTFEESKKGSIEVGKFADLVVLDKDYLTVSEDDIKDIQPLVTMVGGKTVYERTMMLGGLGR
jgi:predicted amidohydrolase YtcJ